MPSSFKYIREAFNKPSVKNEDWLDPSDRVLENIEAEINRGGKKDRSILFFLIPLVLFLIGVSFLLFFNIQEQTKRVEKPNNSLAREATSKELKNINNIVYKAKSKEVKVNEDVVLNGDLNNIENQNLDFIKQQADNKSQEFVESFEVKYTSSTDILEQKNILLNENKIDDIFNNPLQSIQEVKNLSASKNLKSKNHSVYTQKPIFKLENLELQKFYLNVPVSEFPNLEHHKTYANGNTKKQNMFFIEAGTGITFWDFNLNDEYQKLLEPAAFVKTNAVGFNTSLRVGKEINSKLGVSVNVDFANVQLSSGHNSALTFDNTLLEQNHAISMATPLGFVNNDVALFRTAGTNTGETNLLVDLESDHQIEAIDISLAADIDLLDLDRISLTLSPGIGLQQIVNSKNELSSLITNNTDIESSPKVVESEFNDLNSLSPITSLGLSMRKNLKNDWQISFGLNGILNLSPIQENGNLNTRVTRYSAKVAIKKNF